MHRLLTVVRDESGDDLIEYALLAAVVAIAGAVSLATLPGIMNDVYESWDAETQEIWVPPDPE